MVLCDILDHRGHDVPYSPRSMLKKAVARLQSEFGLTAMMASELEFYVFDTSYDEARSVEYQAGKLKLAGDYVTDYHILDGLRREKYLQEVRNGLYKAGVVVECTKVGARRCRACEVTTFRLIPTFSLATLPHFTRSRSHGCWHSLCSPRSL
jgi:glutamine synthetase